jgi:hypothetical protein
MAMVPEAAEPRNGCARLSSPVATPARLAPLGVAPFLAQQESRARRPPLRSGPAGAGLSRSRLWDRRKAAHGRGLAARGADPMTLDRFTDDAETTRNMSPTAHLLDELALYAHRPYDDEADPRPLPEPTKLQGALADMFDALVATLSDTRLEPDLHALLWSLVNVFHRRIDRIERDLDDNERAQRSGQREQDGSEVRSVELERLVAQGLTLIERRNSFEFIRDAAAELYGLHTGQAWRPRTGSMVNRATMTAAMIDSREFINARRRVDAQVLLPKGTRIAFAGGVEYSDHQRIWAVLDKVMAKHADMVLLHGGTPRGAEKIAACWADARKVTQVVFKPDWTRHQKAAPFKRNDQLLEALPIGVVVFPGSGVTDNLADKAKAMGIPLFDCRKAGGA